MATALMDLYTVAYIAGTGIGKHGFEQRQIPCLHSDLN
jgi:hypothetical protein